MSRDIGQFAPVEPVDAFTDLLRSMSARIAELERAAGVATPTMFNVIDYGADPTGNDDSTAAFQAAADAAVAAGSGTVLITAGVYSLSSGFDIDCSNQVVIDVIAHGATINFEGSGVGFTIFDDTAEPNAEYNRGVHVHGGIWQATTSGALGNTSIGSIIRIQDIVSTTMTGVWVRGATNGNGTQLRNLDLYTEQSTFVGCKWSHSARAVDFEPASVSGGTGTESFARTRFVGCVFSGGASAGYLVNLSGDVYGSSFTDCGGNINPGASVYYLNGAHLGTTIINGDFEGGSAASEVFAVGPDIGANYPRIANIRVDLLSSMVLSDDALISDKHVLEQGVRIGTSAAANGQLGLPFGSATTDGIFSRNADDNGDVQMMRVGGSTGNYVLYTSTDGWPMAIGATPATAGHVRLPNDKAVTARNNADSGDVEVLRVATDDLIDVGTFGANVRLGGELYVGNATPIAARNNADSGYVEMIRVNTSDRIFVGAASSPVIIAAGAGSLGFYGTTPIGQQTGVAATAAGIHAALVALGLFTA